MRHGLGGMYGFIPVDRNLACGAVTRISVPGARGLVFAQVAGDLSPEVATLFNHAGGRGIRCETIPEPNQGDVVAVLGQESGGCAPPRHKGASAGFVMVAGWDPVTPTGWRWRHSSEADLAVDVTIDDPVAALTEQTGGLANKSLCATAVPAAHSCR